MYPLGNTVEIFIVNVLLSFPSYLFTTSIPSIKIAYSSRLNGPKQDVPENKSNFRLKQGFTPQKVCENTYLSCSFL